MRVIAIAESDDCGPFAIVDSDVISIIKMDSLYLAATRCAFRNTPITCEISENEALELMKHGVECIDMLQENISSIYEED